MNRPLALALTALLAPAVASAQPASDDPTPPPPPAQPTAPAQQAAPVVVVPNGSTTTNNNTTNTAAPAPAPVITTPAPVVTSPTVVNVPAPSTYAPASSPDSDVVYDRWNMPVFVSGALTFAASYGAAAIASGASDHAGANRLAVPLVGPWLALNDWGNCPVSRANCDQNTTDKVLLIADGVFQAAGVITMLDGLLAPSHHMAVVQTAQRGIHIAPTGTGVKVFGAF